MITGTIAAAGLPVIGLDVAGTSGTAIIDTGFNGGPKLPIGRPSLVNARFICRNRSSLAAGPIIEGDTSLAGFPCDRRVSIAGAIFADHDGILSGGHLLREHGPEINDLAQAVRSERVI